MNKEDRQLAKAILKGQRAALRKFFDRCYGPVYRYCLRRVSPEDAEEIATDTLRQAIRRMETYRGEAALMTWVHQIGRSQLIAHTKKMAKHSNLVLIDDNEKVRQEVEAMAEKLSQSPQGVEEQKQRQHLIHLMLDYLPHDYGTILEWKYIEGLSVAEISARLNTSVTSIQSRLSRARTAFREHFSQLEADPAVSLATVSREGGSR